MYWTIVLLGIRFIEGRFGGRLVSVVIHILLPSFLRRVMRAYEIKAIIRESGAELSRIGRSRNWRLSANREQLTNLIHELEQTDEPSWRWVLTKIKESRGQLTEKELVNLVARNPGISVKELVILANCTIAEARSAIDTYEWQDED
ncbi:ribosome recycling factor family protein [Thalassotalea litorea]|uniref:ribosome recycling factor family protein n=1 Tax=Thalassotalea litorea TaxID=2020715 RepID=UPI0037366BFE